MELKTRKPDTAKMNICGDCYGVFDDPVRVDQGIGAYEYCGFREVHIDMIEVSPCCHEGFFTSIVEMGQEKDREYQELIKMNNRLAERLLKSETDKGA